MSGAHGVSGAGGVRIELATQAAPIPPGRVNEDVAASGQGWAFVLDGATPAPGVATGCRHDVPWLVHRLAAALTSRLTAGLTGAGLTGAGLTETGHVPLAGILAGAIDELRDAHGGSCDLSNPDSPSSTVAMARVRGATVDYLVLCDSPVVLRHTDGGLTLIEDDRLARLSVERPYRTGRVRTQRNRPGGFWVASTDPGAADQALTGSADAAGLSDVALFTDGVTRLAEWYGYPWPLILDRLRDRGPGALIDLVRAAERGYPHPRLKQHDDATVAHLHW